MQPNSVAAQLRRSFLLINATIIVFLCLYVFQAFQLYRRAGQSELWVNRTNDVLQQIKSTQTGVRDIEVALQGYLLTGLDNYKKTLVEKADKTIKRTTYLIDITKENGGQYQRAVTLHDLIVQKKSTALLLIKQMEEGRMKPSDPDIKILMNEGNKEIDELLSVMESTQSEMLASRTSENKSYSRSRISFSVISFFLISAFLSLALYKVRQSITRKSLAEEQARKKEARYRALVENAGVTTLIVDESGVVRFVSKNIATLAGYSAEEVLERPFHARVVREYRPVLHHALFDAGPQAQQNTSAEIQIITADGQHKWVMCRIFPASRETEQREWQVVLWDIEEEKQRALEIEALEAENRNRLKIIQDIIDNVPSVLYIKNVEGTYLIVNKKTEEVFRTPAAELIGRTNEQIPRHTPDRLALYRETDEYVVQHARLAELEETIYEDGVYLHYWVVKFPLLDEKGKVQYVGVMATDITERKATEIKLIESRQEAENAKAAQESFLANMSHEIRTPMNGIIGMANLLMSTDLNDEQKDFTESIHESAQSLLSIINDLLDFSKIKSGKFEFESIPFAPRESIRKAIYPLHFKADEKMIKLNLVIDGNVPEILLGDPLRLQQIVINLAGNALKFTTQGQVEVKLTAEKIAAGKVSLNVAVKDTGIGIPHDKLGQIFESFSQSKAEDARKYGGTGLGLAIVKQLVELQGGVIMVSSTPGKGSVFTFSIPYEVADGRQGVVERDRENDAASYSLTGLRILVAEDNLINQKVVKNTLERQGVILTIASNGQEAIQQVKRGGFDLILMDIQMPEVDGYKATRYLRQVMKCTLPIIAMTADALKGEEDKCKEAGMDGYISKPFEPDQLYRIIAEKTGIVSAHNSGPANTESLPAPDQLVDFSFLKELAGADHKYFHDVLEIFISTMPDGLQQLASLAEAGDDMDALAKQAHFLKSSVGVVKVADMFDQLARVEHLARERASLMSIRSLVESLQALYEKAHPLVLREWEKHKTRQA